MTLRNPTQGPRIVPFGHARLASDKLPNGRPGFRVTQRFYDIDRFFGGYHGAIDIGNFYCGDVLRASHGGWIRNRRDIYGALIVEVVESNGNYTGHGHLSSFARAAGQWVNPGDVIGYVGNTGIGNACHSHMYRVVGGRQVDPWPQLEQNIKPVATSLRGRGRIAGPNCNIRSTRSLSGPIYATSRTDGWTYRTGGARLWANTSLFIFLRFTGDWADVRTGGGLNLFIHRNVFVVTIQP